MPQLDRVTYLSQLFWLIVFFLSFYLVMLKFILPTIAKTLKVRKKQILQNQRELASLKKEESALFSESDSLLIQSFIESKNYLTKAMEQSLSWVQKSINEANESTLRDVNSEYVRALGELSGKRYIIQEIIRAK